MANKTFSLKTVLLEIFIVIVGITIAFWVNNWGEERKERRLETEFLKTLRADLAADSASFSYQISENKKNVDLLYRFIQIIRDQDYENDSITKYLGSFMNRNNWIVNGNTFDILKSGGKLDIISDFQLRSDISLFFRFRTYQTEGFLEISQDFVDNRMNVYLTKKSDYYISNTPDNGIIKDREFQNLLVIWTELTDDKLSIYEAVLADITMLISKLDAELK